MSFPPSVNDAAMAEQLATSSRSLIGCSALAGVALDYLHRE